MDSNTQVLSRRPATSHTAKAQVTVNDAAVVQTLSYAALALLGVGAAVAAYRYYDSHRALVKRKMHKAANQVKSTAANATHPSSSTTTSTGPPAKKQAVPASQATITTTGLTSSSKNGSRYGSRRGSASGQGGKLYAHEDTIVGGVDSVASLSR